MAALPTRLIHSRLNPIALSEGWGEALCVIYFTYIVADL